METDRSRIVNALPGYEVGDEVGRGAWGVVFRAEHRQLGRVVAVKELPPAFGADPDVRRRFLSEARLLASLDHPHIVPIFDYVEDDGLCLLVMEHLPGGTVWDRFRSEGIAPETACVLALATCSALHHAHGLGILHRDIKPENLMFSAAGQLKVTDFGIAKVLGGSLSTATRAGEVLGTPAYIAPEQAVAGQLSPATDVYAVGTLLYELLAGTLPFADDGNPITLLYRHAHEPPTPLLQVKPGVPVPLAVVTMRALATDPAERYPSAEDFGADLADAANEAWGSGWLERSGLEVVASGKIAARISGGGQVPPVDPWPDIPPPGPRSTARWTPGPASVPPPPAPAPPPTRAPSLPPSAPAPPPTRAPSLPPAAAAPTAPDPTATAEADAPRAEDGRATHLVPEGRGPAPDTPRPAPVRRRRRRWPAAIAAVVVVAAGAVGATLALKGSPSRNDPLVYRDSLTSSTSGWKADAGEDGLGTTAYVPGGLQLKVDQQVGNLSTYSAASPYPRGLRSLTVTVDQAVAADASDDGAGVRCDVNGRTGVRYTFEVRRDGSWLIFRLGSPSSTSQAALANGHSASIRTGGATNTVSGQCTQQPDGRTRLALTVNGQLLGTVVDSPGKGPIAWRAALVAYRSQASGSQMTEVLFTDFRTYGK